MTLDGLASLVVFSERVVGTGIADCKFFFALGVPGVIVVFVAVVVEDIGREGILYGGFESGCCLALPFCGTCGIESWLEKVGASVLGCERDRERVRKL